MASSLDLLLWFGWRYTQSICFSTQSNQW